MLIIFIFRFEGGVQTPWTPPLDPPLDGVVKCWRQLVERELSSKGASIESIFDLDDLSNYGKMCRECFRHFQKYLELETN